MRGGGGAIQRTCAATGIVRIKTGDATAFAPAWVEINAMAATAKT